MTLKPIVVGGSDTWSGTATWKIVLWNTTALTVSQSQSFTVTYTPPLQLIVNSSFSSGFEGWNRQGSDSWAGTNLSNYHTSPGYAALGVDSTGWAKDGADGAFYQTVSIPPGVGTASLSFWYSITTHENTSTAYDNLYVTIRDSDGNFLAYVTELSNVDKTTGYVQKTFDLTPYIGRTIRVRFGATSDASDTTTFRIDDVSIQTN
jgi:hypothetical protein